MDDKPIIIIKKRGKKKPHEAHGGSWKIAYADFVTAMMAFFLLMWLLSVTNEDQKKGIADYFAPNFIETQAQGGSSGLLGGVNLSNPNNSSGKSSQERAKSTDIEVDVLNSKSQEAFQDKKDVSVDVSNAAKKVKVDPTNSSAVKMADSANQVKQETVTIGKEQVGVDPSTTNSGQAAKDAQNNLATSPHSVKTDSMNQVRPEQNKVEAAKGESANAEPATVETKKMNQTIEKIVKTDLNEIKVAKEQANEKALAAKALIQAAETAKDKKAATTYERSIENAMSDQKIEHQKAIDKAMAESKEKGEAIKKLQLAENEKLKEVAAAIKDIIQKNPELKGLMPHLILENRSEGLRIQLIDKDKRSMFASGSSSMTPLTRQLLKTVAGLIEKMPNSLVVSGHTDAHPFVGARKYSNWELSADRANATRRTLEEFNINAKRFESVMGKEATDPFVREDPFNESNRRISITLLREYGAPSTDMFKQMTGG